MLVAGAGGFIGGHLVARLRADGHRLIRAVDCKPPDAWMQRFDDVDNLQLDLRELAACREACADVAEVYNFAADMGGMGFIEHHKAACMLSVLINTHLLLAARDAGCRRYLFASSACVYPVPRQASTDVVPLQEHEAYPAMPEDGYGWEKLFGERMCRHFSEDFGLVTRIARYHNVYGPYGTFDGGREKAPAAICRKVAQAALLGDSVIEIWGDGRQSRSFTFIDDCIEGTLRLMDSDHVDPLNIGSSELVTIDALVRAVEAIAGVTLHRVHKPDAPTGVRGRNSDNTRCRAALGWEPSTPLADGLRRTYEWIVGELTRAGVTA